MKTIKKMMALVIAMVMVLASLTVVSAEQATAKINFPTDSRWASHTYEIYQIYIGDVDTTKDQGLLDLKYGANHSGTHTAGDAVSQDEITALQKLVANARDTADLTDLLKTNGYVDITGTPYKTLSSTTEGKAVTVETGYYLIKDVDDSQNSETSATDAKAYTLYILEVLDADVNITPKADVPSSDKKVADINDSSDTAQGAWGTDADYDIGDYVPFQLTATTASNVYQYKNYHITFEDQKSDGLDAPENFTIQVGSLATFYMDYAGEFYTDNSFATKVASGAGTALTTNGTKITVTKPAADQGQTFAIKVAFVNNGYKADGTDAEKALGIPAEANSLPITITYAMKLNTSANVGTIGNPNKSYIRYSNNPNNSDDSDEGTTPEKTVIVFTYKIDVDKVDQDYDTLTGAGFALLKELASGTATVTISKPEDLVDVADETIVSYNSKTYKVVKNWGVKASGYNFDYEGIDDGNYVLVETVVPTGYNRAADVSFTVSATHADKTLTALSAGDSFNTTLSGGALEFKKASDETKTHSVATGTDKAAIATIVVNQSGATLPETGGIGTTLFYAGGAILVLLAGILLVSKRRAA